MVLAEAKLDNMALGAQDVFWADRETATGETSPEMLKDMHVKYVIVGHSDRRLKLHETEEEIWRKVGAVQKEGLTPILCVGEPWEVHMKGENACREYVLNQLSFEATSLVPQCALLDALVIAYEPIWAISTSGTGQQCSPSDAADIIRAIRRALEERCGISAVRILYGGTVNEQTARGFLREPDIDGVLVGQASLNAKEFQKIIEIAAA